jgi:AcrR family transcriptional regulator
LGRRENKREATRQEILTAAKELFQTKGFDATSIDDIGAAADVAKGTFYYHFDSKEALLSTLHQSVLQKATDEANEKIANGAPPLQILFSLLAEIGQWTEANPEFTRVMLTQHAMQFTHGGTPDNCPVSNTQDHHGFVGLIKELVLQAQQAKEIRNDITVEEVHRIVMPVIMATRSMWLLHREGSLVERQERSMQLLLEGLSPARK